MIQEKFQQLAQWVGFLTIGALALYGLVTIGSGRIWAAGEASIAAETNATSITIPSTFNYQGFLRDGNGNPMTGEHTLVVKLWTLVSGGTELYTETFANVSVRDGLFNVLLGDVSGGPLNSIFQNQQAIFVGVTVDGGTELIPRQRIHPVPWALLSTNAQNATTATTLTPNASVQNLTNKGALSIDDANHRIDATSDQFTNGDVLRFFGPKGFSWVGADKNQYIMHLNDTTGLEVYGLNVAGSMTVSGVKPILIKRYNGKLVNNTEIDTGISATNYRCTVGGWAVNMDIDENGYGLWARWAFVKDGKWFVQLYNKVHGQTPNPEVFFDVLCFHNNMVDFSEGAASSRDSDLSLPDTSSQDVGQ